MTRRWASLNWAVGGAALALAGAAMIIGAELATVVILAVALLTVAVPRPAEPVRMQGPSAELARCRRYSGRGLVMVVSSQQSKLRQRRQISDRLARSLRITDGVAALEAAHEGPLLCGVFSDPDVEAESIERRLRALQPDLEFGWAEFPDDGLTLAEVLGVAGDRSLPPTRVAAPVARVALRPRPELGMQTSSMSSWKKEG